MAGWQSSHNRNLAMKNTPIYSKTSMNIYNYSHKAYSHATDRKLVINTLFSFMKYKTEM